MEKVPEIRKRGRPPIPPELCRSQRVVTFVTTNELEHLQELATADQQPLSATVHQLITQGLSARDRSTR